MTILFVMQQGDSVGQFQPVMNAVNGLTDVILNYAITLAAVGALAMALVEFWKKVYDARARFHARRFTEWVRKSFPEASFEVLPEGLSAAMAITEIIQLSTGVSRKEAEANAKSLESERGEISMLHAVRRTPANAVFALELERMMGAIQEAGDAALTAPERYKNLYAFITIGGDPEDVKKWYANARTAFTKAGDLTSTREQEIKELADMIARLRQVMKRRLDAFQLYTSESWASYNQTGGNVVGFLIMVGILLTLDRQQTGFRWWEIVLLALGGGMLSPIAKDLVSSLRKARQGV
jgi:hypothetical protein